MVGLNGRSAAPVVAVDAMGGDNAPHEVVAGAVDAHRQGANVLLVGDQELVRARLTELGADLPVVHAPSVIGMDEPVSQAVRREDTSLRICAELVQNGDASAAISCGNSAAIMGLSLLVFGRLPGIKRPAFGGYLPVHNGRAFVLDIGANAEVKSNNLVQFAVMGDVYVRLSSDLEYPRIALLSNGSEDSKGTKEIKEANEAIRKLDLNFVGNIEGNHVFEGSADVVVCDGFTGNILLKGAEGVAGEILDLLRNELSRDLMSRVAAAAMMPAFTRIKKRLDYQEYGGVPVLGVNHVMINCHGRSKARAVYNGILVAEKAARDHLPVRIGEAMEADEVELNRRRRLARAFHLRHSPA